MSRRPGAVGGQVLSLHQHVAALIAVFLALATGIVLGAGPLGGAPGAGDTDRGELAGAEPTESTGPSASEGGVDAAYVDAFASAGATRLYADGLRGHAAAVLVLPGADPTEVKALTAQVPAAGGALTGTYTLGADLLDPAAAEDADTSTSLLAAQLADPRLDASAGTWERAGQLVGLATATGQQRSTRADDAAVTVRDALGSAGLLASPSDVRLAPVLLVVLPAGEQSSAERAELEPVLTGLVDGLASVASGVVVAGDSASARAGALGVVRAGRPSGAVSTVDGTESALGRVSAVLAMIGVTEGVTGAFGESGEDGAVPTP
ncbi:copper transporter [Nocardioides flavescens]|uniref:Copper transport outer membrane protein, MctB n=1 Tax=Nocardioides flavescens TaxID=2691959 RepID=A0A6L7F4K5_9ACTN|nr:hypothetical protein [Nocardioides flavescens]